MRYFWAFILSFVPIAATAQDLADALLAQIERSPEAYLDDVAVIISGYGTGGSIDKSALQNLVAMQRADARALGFRRLQGADLDGDGAIAGDEMQIKAAASAAAARGRLILYFGKADADADGRVSVAELQEYANQLALKVFSPQKEAELYGMLSFDKNGDGRVTLNEVRAGVANAASGKAKLTPAHGQKI